MALIDDILVIAGERGEVIYKGMDVDSFPACLVSLEERLWRRNGELDIVNGGEKISDERGGGKIEVEREMRLVGQRACKASIREKASLIRFVARVTVNHDHWETGRPLE